MAKRSPQTTTADNASAAAGSANLTVSRAIELEPADYLTVTYRARPAMPPRPEPVPFDREECRGKIRGVRKRQGDYQWDEIPLPARMSREEAHLWFWVFGQVEYNTDPAKLLPKLEKTTFDGRVNAQAAAKLISKKCEHGGYLSRIAADLLPPGECAELFLDTRFLSGDENVNEDTLNALTYRVAPYLGDTETKRLQALVRPVVTPQNWHGKLDERFHFFLAALLGCHKELEAVVASWPDDQFRNVYVQMYEAPHRVVFGLGSADKVEQHFRRLKFQLISPEDVRAWLAHTGVGALDVARDSVLAATRKEDAAALLKELCRVKAPEVAPFMLELSLESKATGIARDWLNANVGSAVAGLLPVAAGHGKLAKAAVDYLREVKRKGYTQAFDEALKTATPEQAAFLQRAVLEHQEKVYAVLEESELPGDMRKAFAAAANDKKPALPDWAEVGALPPILLGGSKLSESHVLAVLHALKSAPGGPEPALLIALRRHAEPNALDAFAWHLFESWVRAGMPSKEKWAFVGLGLFGRDETALKLTPHIREWPGMSKHAHAVTGLEVLRAIGTDTALMQLNGVAQKVKFQGIKARAREMMDAIAADRGMSRAELEDRIVPDLELDERGGRTFDFGPRQFRVALAADLTPIIRDADGKTRPDLPKPGAKDDAAKAEAAVAGWKLLKKQLREVLKLQGPRLEQAMVTMRRWPVGDFERLLVRHPLMTNLVRRLVWGGYDANGKLVRTFRVTEEKDYAGSDDRAVSLTDVATVGIVHPLHLSEPDRTAWGQLMGEYELIAPFAQLGRPILRPSADEAKARDITRFAGVRIPSGAVWGGAEKLGWTRGSSSDHGVVMEFVKQFPSAGVTAVFNIEPGIARGMLDMLGEQRILRGFFLNRLYDPVSYPYYKDEQKRPLGKVDPVAVSEVLADLTALAAKGT